MSYNPVKADAHNYGFSGRRVGVGGMHRAGGPRA